MKKDRQQQILSILEREGFLSTADAARRLHSSEATIRRDFQTMTREHLARRTHGGLSPLLAGDELVIPISLRQEWNAAEKRHLCRKAAELLPPAGSLIVYGGSTTGFLGEYLHSGSVVTNLVPLAAGLGARVLEGKGPQIFLTGGELDAATGSLKGPMTLAGLSRMEFDAGITSSYGMDESGLSDTGDEYVHLMTQMMQRARRRIVIADHTKFQKHGLFRGMRWPEIHTLVTTFCPDNHAILQAIRAQGVEVILCDPPAAEPRPDSADSVTDPRRD